LAGGRTWQASVPVADADGESALSVLWARQNIAALMDRRREGAPEEEIRAAVLQVALEHKLVSRYTSLVAVDRTPARTAEALLKSAAVATNLPEGWSYEGIFGVPGELPRGATSLRFDLLAGVLLLLVAGFLWRRARG
jgi:Ca-activated chloride channel family protein